MENVMTVASYVYNRYQSEYHEKIDEMKLHKLLYFAQRESLVQTNEPLFDAPFYGWRYGPVLKDIRDTYKSGAFQTDIPAETAHSLKGVMDKIFEEYAGEDSWSLSRLTHGEISWKISRKGISPTDKGSVAIALDDIRLDADRIRTRREMLSRFSTL